MKNNKYIVWAVPLLFFWIITITLFFLKSNSDNKEAIKISDPNRPKFLFVDQLNGMEVYDNYPCSTKLVNSEEIKTINKIPHHAKVEYISEIDCQGSDKYHIGTEYTQIKYENRTGWVVSFFFEDNFLSEEKMHHFYEVTNTKDISLYSKADKRNKLLRKLPNQAKVEVLQVIHTSGELEWKKILYENKIYWVNESVGSFRSHSVE